MDERMSVYLDAIRVIATMAVLFHHLSLYNHETFPFLLEFGHTAVITFFVLSGYVIAYVATEREKKFSTYLIHRFSRMYSVLVVAWILTAILDTLGPSINPVIYIDKVSTDLLIVRLFSHLFFLHESWFFSIHFFGNAPLWSISFEFSYYLLFGLIVLYKGRYKKGLVALVALIVGPVILIYGLIWAMGVLIYKLHQQQYTPTKLLASVIFLVSLIIIVLTPQWSEYINFGYVAEQKLEVTTLVRDLVFSLIIATNIYFFKYTNFSFAAGKSVIRFFAKISFSLYVFHFPLMLFSAAVILKYFNISNETLFVLQTFIIISCVYLLSFISEKKKKAYFQFFQGVFEYIKKSIPVISQSSKA
jgi:peptidoglycan/LPS O-acetylase OafA/YrhL